MKNDPYESNNLVDQQPERQAELARLWNEWNKDNISNILQQAAQYQEGRYDFYEKLYEERLKQSEERKAYKIK